ncbi:guanine deaminase [Methylomarinovum caldicuralii]|uniref:Guanine deaminase n=1 Tax=Methylomarinovum caldicuralii TaxID=438856 RepID=A0AAU9CQE9_9GAMM|nr:guanine deaminase [Methylomarinovum caldicuralii]BCX81717.1 guanine deaminase [Methylomarinovum caldicuralii]
MTTVYLGTLAHLRGNPFVRPNALEIIADGALWVDGDGRIAGYGRAGEAPETGERVDFGAAWLLPGLIDAHLHFPQYYAVAAANRGLLSWLRETVYPEEAAFRDAGYAAGVARALVARLLRGGVTCACVFGSQYLEATGALFEAAGQAGLRLIAGVTLMDRNGPDELLTTPERAWWANETLLERYGGDPRLHLALTPRFALSCSPQLLAMCGEFRRRHPQVYLQTHINETLEEIAAVQRAFPDAWNYLDVYERYGLLGPRTLLAHDIHPQSAELRRMAESECRVVHCPSSNLFLGSGLFPLRRHVEHGIPLALGSDIGAGLHLSVWEELSEAYKIQRLQGETPTAAQLLYLATLGAAEALELGGEIGNFLPGKAADFFVLDPGGDDYLDARLQRCPTLEARLFVLMQLAGSGHVRRTFVAGRPVSP